MIDEFIDRRGKDTDRLYWIASRLGYRVLQENYRNLASAFQYALYVKMVERIRLYKETGYIRGILWGEAERDEVEKILADPNGYFMKTAKDFADDRMTDRFCKNNKIYGTAILEEFKKSNRVIVYGAGVIGKELVRYLTHGGIDKENISFAVTDKRQNVSEQNGIVVREISEYLEWRDTALVAIAVKEQIQFPIAEKLEQLEFKNVISMDRKIRSYIREEWEEEKKL